LLLRFPLSVNALHLRERSQESFSGQICRSLDGRRKRLQPIPGPPVSVVY
jgi:hypothetical protein